MRHVPRHHRSPVARPVVGPLVAAAALTVLAACENSSPVVGRATATVAPVTSAPAATAPAATAPATTAPATTAPATTAPATTVGVTTAAAGTYEVARVVGRLVDDARGGRVVSYQVYAPVGVDGPVPVLLVSHGGQGNPRGHLAGEHLGSTFASGGFVAIHLAHDRPADGSSALVDRPADVTFLLDQLAAGRVDLPDGFTGAPDLERVGHTGHSFGAYTSHAVGGATYRRTFRDDRIDAIAPISPQGPDQFGGFVNGPDDSTWTTVTIPAYDVIGGDEISSNAVDSIERAGWRLAPFDHYPGTSDTFRTIIAGQDHGEMWSNGAPDVEAFVAGEILDFMRVYVAGDTTVDPCSIGVGSPTSTTASLERGPAATGSRLTACV